MIAWVASTLSILGVLLNARRRRSCWVVWTIANGLWVYISAERSDWAQVVLWLVFVVVNAYGWVEWGKRK